jgi:hypothetical protein
VLAPQRDHHARHTGRQLGGRDGGQKLRTTRGLHRALPCPLLGSESDQTTLPDSSLRFGS